MKTFLALLIALLPLTSFGEETELSKIEEAHCRAAGCFSQYVVTNVKIKKVGRSLLYSSDNSDDVYVEYDIKAEREYEPGQIVEVEYQISSWVGKKGAVEKEYRKSAATLAKHLRKAQASGESVTLVIRGAANIMTAEFPILGYFSTKGEAYFLERTSVPLLEGL